MSNNKFELIREFIRTYFHADWYLDDSTYESVWKGYMDEFHDPKDVVPLNDEIKELLKISPKEIHTLMCDEDFCLSSEQEAHNWMKSLNEYIEKRMLEMK
jgi:hypothetical protein